MARFHKLKVKDVRKETGRCISIGLDVPQELRQDFEFTQGQYLTLKQSINEVDVRRSYSICAGLDDGLLRVAIKHVPGGSFSSWANESKAHEWQDSLRS